jgi:hypothetical protein
MSAGNPWSHFGDRVGRSYAAGWLKIVFAMAMGVIFRAPPIIYGAGGAGLLVFYLRYKGRYREAVYVPVSSDELPWRARKYFEEHTSAFEQCGFKLIGDFLVSKTYGQSHVRGFVHRSFPILAELNDSLYSDIRNTYSMVSAVEDGTIVTSSRRSGAGIPEMAMLHFVFAKGASPQEMLEQQLAAMRGYESVGFRMLPLAAADLESVMRYGYYLVRWNLYSIGFAGRPPSPDDSWLRRLTGDLSSESDDYEDEPALSEA